MAADETANVGTGTDPVPSVNPEDVNLPETKAAKAAAAKAVPWGFEQYIAAGEKPPKSMVDTPQKMKDYLNAFPKVKVLAPLTGGEKKGKAYETVKINGIETTFKKGVFVELPEPMANLVMEHYQLLDTGMAESKSADGVPQLSTN